MNRILSSAVVVFRAHFVAALLIILGGVVHGLPMVAAADADPLAAIKTAADLEKLIAATTDATRQQALRDQTPAIVAAAKRKSHVDRVVAVLEQARASMIRSNDTPEKLKAAFGGPSALFDSLKEINLADTSLSIKSKREVDPFDAAFYEDVAGISNLESFTIINTTAQNAWLAPIGKMSSLKTLRIINQAKLNDEGLALLSGLRQLESFGYIGTAMTGEPFKDFKGWTNLKTTSYRGSRMNDAGLIALCEAFPNLQSLVLAHGHYTDAAVAKVATLKQLTGLEIGSNVATPACLKHLVGLPLEYLQLGDGLDTSAGIATIAEIKTLKRLTLTNCKATTDADLKLVAALPNLQNLEFSNLDLPESRLPQLQQFAFLKNLRLVNRPQTLSSNVQDAIKKLLPKTELKFD